MTTSWRTKIIIAAFCLNTVVFSADIFERYREARVTDTSELDLVIPEIERNCPQGLARVEIKC